MGSSSSSLSIIWLLLLNILCISVTLVSCTTDMFPRTSMLRGNETDRFALLAFKARVTSDPHRILRSWNVSVHHCQWYGVTCGHRHQRVTALDLQSQKLAGSITPHLGNLSFLVELNLKNNSLIGVTPSELGRLRRLQYLSLSYNSMTGVIPANLSSCSNLVFLDLGFNNLVGEIPIEIGSLLTLKVLHVPGNELTGQIPPLGNLTSLQKLFVSENYLSGNIPDSIGKLTSLIRLIVNENLLTGTLPPSIFNLSSIESFYVSGNRIRGNLPSNLGIVLPYLRILSISLNNFTGPIPVSLSNATNLIYLSAFKNKFIGNVPNFGKLHKLVELNMGGNLLGFREADDLSFLSSLANASNLKIVGLTGNNFGGTLSAHLVSNLSTTLQTLALAINHIHGTIPSGLANLVNLQILYLGANRFRGYIPSEIGRLKELQVLDLAENNFFGNIPSSIGNLSFLSELYLENNNLQGSIPSSLGECRNFFWMDLSQNKLTGIIPQEVLGITSLTMVLNLSYNYLSGSLPTNVGSLKSLEMLDISKNNLSGEIPSTLGSCLSLEVLYMDGNNFQGIIPSSFSSLRGLRNLDLSSNNLSGPIPYFFEGFDLKYLNLSFNNFSGEVPRQGIFKNKSSVFVNGNDRLCGGVLELELSNCSTKGSKKKKLSFVAFIISGSAGLSLILCLIFFFWFKGTKKESVTNLSENKIPEVSYNVLLKATDGFSSANMIGAGSFGSVYKGIIEQFETIIAVKVLNLSHRRAFKSFIAECEALRNIRHRNLVKVISVCSGIDYQGNDFKALIYEYMVNGSLEKWLHPSPSDVEIPTALTFLQRLNAAIDVACALEYLHHGCHTPIVHCDLKPSNVLFDSEMTAHVGDFGLARFVQEASRNSTTNQSSSIGIRGTIGYIAPEYGMGSKVSTSGDVYSYGILVLEMFTGKSPTDEIFKDGENLQNYAKNALPDRVAEIADSFILQEIEEDKARPESSTRRNGMIEECLNSIIGVGVSCSAEFARERMSMTEVTARLQSIRDIFLGTGIHKHRGRAR